MRGGQGPYRRSLGLGREPCTPGLAVSPLTQCVVSTMFLNPSPPVLPQFPNLQNGLDLLSSLPVARI